MSEGLKRRDFLKVLGASGAGAAAVGCSTGEVERLIPYVIPDENVVPGLPTWYASTCMECPAGCGIQVETHSGRVTKVEGNDAHPVSRGNLCARGQASVQGLYHPDRLPGPSTFSQATGRQNVTWGTAESIIARRIQEAGSGRTAILTRRYGGSMDQLVDEWASAVGAHRVVYDPFGDQPRDAQIADADLLVSFGADFLETWGSPVDYTWQFSQMHGYREGRRGKFVWVGPHRPLTGLNADEWIAARPGTEIVVAQALAGQVSPAEAAREAQVDEAKLASLVEEFGRGRAVALGPGRALAGSDTRALRAAIAGLNGGGATAPQQGGGAADVTRLVQAMQAGDIDVLLIDASNPVHTLPAGLGFEEALTRVRTRVSFSSMPDDTSKRCNFLLPQHHFLEAWGDYEPRPGVRSLVQPAMRPVFNTKQLGDVLIAITRRLAAEAGAEPPIGVTTYLEFLRESFGLEGEAWRQALRDGGQFDAEPVPAPAGPGVQDPPSEPTEQPELEAGVMSPPDPAAVAGGTAAAAATRRPQPFEGPEDGLHLLVYPSYRFFDGRNADRPWLLELPDPVTKVSWDSWVELHPETAEELGLRQGEVVEVTSEHGTIEAPVYRYPGVRRDTVAIQMGLGHEEFGRYTRERGANPNRLLGPAIDQGTDTFASYGIRVRVSSAGRRHPLYEAGARVQHDREVAQAISLASVRQADEEGPGVIPGEDKVISNLRGFGGFGPAPRQTDPASGFPPAGTEYGEYIEGATRWAMAIDLQRCTGCSACVTACYAENNIPVVGPDQVRQGREMAWIRIERYFGVTRDESEGFTDEATDDTRFLPMLCQHCSNAPCEPVCPVYAAYHTPDGLNGQVYNRCVGTRYCANNCPYKVRTFNWFEHDFAQPLNWQLNPDVTVREKGVMEKCTFCVQRIHEVERNAAKENRPVQDGEIVPACVQTCPAEVFVFGNIADPESEVAQVSRSNRSYRALEFTNVQPAIVYLKKVTLEEPEVSVWAH
jgi:anaerobic selenocysteine-containing dehydrogenase/Fe-S-cluster-containing dehydrogenase component